MERLPIGKISIPILESTVLRLTGAKSDRVVTPGKAGVDFAAVRLRHGFLIVSADPITGASERIGEYALKVSANDVATSGTAPSFAEPVILMPEGSTVDDLERVARQIHRSAKELGISIIGGHTEVTPNLVRPIVVVTTFGIAERFVSSADARNGDSIMMTKTAGLEGTAELAAEYQFPQGSLSYSTLKKARGFIERIDVTKEAVAAYGTGQVHAMHDCTEGGVLGALYEMSLASGLGFVLDEDAVPVAPETTRICAQLKLDPLRLIGSGSLLLSVSRGSESEVKRALRPICTTNRVGEFRIGPKLVIERSGSRRQLTEAPQDELWRVLGRMPSGGSRP